MVLLTSSTVSAIVSFGVVCIFSLMLFLAGYVVQQQSVKNIQHALRPPVSRHGGGFGSQGSTFQNPAQKRGLSDSDLSSDPRPSSGGNYAYLQLLSTPDPSDICSSISFFKQLATNGSVIQDRLFMYPEEWERMSETQLGKPASTALSILRNASIKYGIWLLPIDMTAASSKGYSATDTKLLRLGQIQFMQYDSVLYLPSRGIILDTEKLDDIILSQALPLVYDKDRPDSYDNLAWTPMTLRPDRDADLPPVYLITVNNIGSGNVQARTHVPSSNLPMFQALVRGSGKIISQDEDDHRDVAVQPPAYVYFETDHQESIKFKKSSYYQNWRSQRDDVCDGLNFDDDFTVTSND
ncbi:uncharacterized protein N7484_003316 [Penicillium longicatenatum]|uniref:uncharacterized protein n=1 Tax=Penicillium longicatenatum TaxID=1561947 RepID=UPI002547E3F0|nr:uncharacterized protein N7484_003316 [Penicillium longicatenatum]KAJ5649593.1 hypothetical protein N7484_003316 [Penicillium longicatenatum]